MSEGTFKYIQVIKIGNFCYPWARFFITFHGDIDYFAYTVSPYGNHNCGVISLFELHLIS